MIIIIIRVNLKFRTAIVCGVNRQPSLVDEQVNVSCTRALMSHDPLQCYHMIHSSADGFARLVNMGDPIRLAHVES